LLAGLQRAGRAGPDRRGSYVLRVQQALSRGARLAGRADPRRGAARMLRGVPFADPGGGRWRAPRCLLGARGRPQPSSGAPDRPGVRRESPVAGRREGRSRPAPACCLQPQGGHRQDDDVGHPCGRDGGPRAARAPRRHRLARQRCGLTGHQGRKDALPCARHGNARRSRRRARAAQPPRSAATTSSSSTAHPRCRS